MERGSGKHSPREDDQLKHELRGTLQGNRPVPAAPRNGETRSHPPTTILKCLPPVRYRSNLDLRY